MKCGEGVNQADNLGKEHPQQRKEQLQWFLVRSMPDALEKSQRRH